MYQYCEFTHNLNGIFMTDPHPEEDQTIRIVVVDDRPAARSAIRALLAAFESEMHPGCLKNGSKRSQQHPDRSSTPTISYPHLSVVAEACQGAQAVELVDKYHPDIVLIDARMPVMDGMEATRHIKQRWPKVRVLMLSMYTNYKLDAYQAGADVFLLKGCPAEELLQAIVGSPQGDQITNRISR